MISMLSSARMRAAYVVANSDVACKQRKIRIHPYQPWCIHHKSSIFLLGFLDDAGDLLSLMIERYTHHGNRALKLIETTTNRPLKDNRKVS